MKSYLLVMCMALHGLMPSSLGAMEPQKASPSIEELVKRMRNFNVWQKVEPEKIKKGVEKIQPPVPQSIPLGNSQAVVLDDYDPKGDEDAPKSKWLLGGDEAAIVDDYNPQLTPYQSWRLLLDERAKELEEEIEQHNGGDTIRRLICMQNFCWANPVLFWAHDIRRAELATAIVLQPKEVFMCPNPRIAHFMGYGLEEIYCFPDTIHKIGPRSPQSWFTDFAGYAQEILYAKTIPGTQCRVLSSLCGEEYVLKVVHPYERLKHPLKITGPKPVLRVAVDTSSVAWTMLDEKSQLRLKVWQSDEGEVLDEEIHPKEANFPFAWRRAPKPITAVAIGASQLRICEYENKVLSQKLKVAGMRDYTIGSEPILDVALVPQEADFALLTQSHAHFVRCNSAREFSWNKTIVLPICPHQFSFSPDGKSLAVAGMKKDGQKSDNRNLYAIDLTTGQHTENLADHLDLKQVNPAGPAFKVTMLSDGIMHISSELIPEKKSGVSYKTREQLLLPIDFKTLLVLKAMQQVCVHPLLVQCAQYFGCPNKNFEDLATLLRTKRKYLQAIERSTTFQQCSPIWQTILKEAIADERKGLRCSDDPQDSDEKFMNESGFIDRIPVDSGIRHLMKKMASECKEHE